MKLADRETRWTEHDAAWRDPASVVASSALATPVDPELLRMRVRGDFWELLDELELTLLVTREYEHLVVALSVYEGRPYVTHLSLPHPSGIAFDETRGLIHVAATRNPNQLVTLAPVSSLRSRTGHEHAAPVGRPLMPVRTRFLPGCLYLHDLAMVAGDLCGNAVGENAVVRFDLDGTPRRVWWPRAIDGPAGPDFSRNYLQLNSIAAADALADSFFSASAERPGRLRPGHRNFPVDGRGVIFSAASREPVVRGLTRPHSARLRAGVVWVANSGYGTLGPCGDGEFTPHARLPGWTRGLGLVGNTAFVGSSRVIPRFRRYAPGLDVDRSSCGVHAVDLPTGEIRSSLSWPNGNQIFAIEPIPSAVTSGFIRRGTRSESRKVAHLYYSYDVDNEETKP